MFYLLTNNMYPRLNIAINSCKSLPLVFSRLGVSKTYDEIKRNEDSISNAFLEQIIITINKSYEIGVDDFITSPKKCQMINDLSVSGTLINDLYEWRINPVNIYYSEMEDQISFYTSLFIRKNDTVFASLLYDLENDIFYTAVRSDGAKIENRKLRITSQIPNDYKFICDNDDISNIIVKELSSSQVHVSSILNSIISLVEEQVDFLIFTNLDIKEIQSEILILQEAKMMTKVCLSNLNKKVLVVAKSRIFQKVLDIIES